MPGKEFRPSTTLRVCVFVCGSEGVCVCVGAGGMRVCVCGSEGDCCEDGSVCLFCECMNRLYLITQNYRRVLLRRVSSRLI